MMATTHALAGLALVAPAAVVFPEFAGPLALGALLGGVAPDVDLVLEHRRTLHAPLAGLPIAAAAVGLAVVIPSSATVALVAFALAAWVHAVGDALGGGPEMDPWTDPSDRAVYDHVRGRWLRPRRLIRYDGAPEDGALALVLALPAVLVFEGPIPALVAGLVAVSILYVLLRRRLVAWLPDWLE